MRWMGGDERLERWWLRPAISLLMVGGRCSEIVVAILFDIGLLHFRLLI